MLTFGSAATMDCSIKSAIEWTDAGTVISMLWLLGLVLIIVVSRSSSGALQSIRISQYSVIALVLWTALLPAMYLGSFDLTHCLPHRSVRHILVPMCVVFPALAWAFVLNGVGKIVVALCALLTLVVFAYLMQLNTALAVLVLLAIACTAWWYVVPLAIEESDDFDGNRG